jgi:hypothetical protein
MDVTVATVIRNMCLSRNQKADLESLKICIQTLVSITKLVSHKPNQTPAAQSVHNLSRSESEPNLMSKWVVSVTIRKLSSLVTFFVYEVSREVITKFHQKSVLYRKV